MHVSNYHVYTLKLHNVTCQLSQKSLKKTNLLKKIASFSSGYTPFHIPPVIHGSSNISTSLPTHLLPFNDTHSSRYEVVLICIFVTTTKAEHLSYGNGLCVYLLWGSVCSGLLSFGQLCYLFYYWVLKLLYLFWK